MPYLRQLNDQRGTLKPLPRTRGWKQRGRGLDTSQRVVGKSERISCWSTLGTASSEMNESLTRAISGHQPSQSQPSSHLPQPNYSFRNFHRRQCQHKSTLPFFFASQNLGSFNSAVCSPNSGSFFPDLAARVAARPARCPQYPLCDASASTARGNLVWPIPGIN